METKGRGTMDYGLIGIVSVMILFGLIVLLSASSPNAYKQFGDSYYFLKHQIIFGLIPGIAGLIAFSRIPYLFWKKHAWNLLIASIVLLLLVFIPGFSAGFGTSHSWVSIGGLFSIQPSEIAKLTFLFYLAGWLSVRDEKSVSDFQSGLIPFLSALGLIALLMVLQPDTGSTTILAAMSLVVYFVAGAPLAYIGGLFALGLTGISLLVAITPYRAARLTTFLHPELDPKGIGYHINQALLALGSGGFFGFGYGHSRQKFQYLPEVAGDSIFAVIGEEMGFIVCVLVIVMFLVLSWRLMEIAKYAPDKFSKYICIGVGAWILVQAFENIGSMAALLPITGVPLPFISYGGTSLAVLMSAIGVVLNISKNTK